MHGVFSGELIFASSDGLLHFEPLCVRCQASLDRLISVTGARHNGLMTEKPVDS